jgi:hypothetical protein
MGQANPPARNTLFVTSLRHLVLLHELPGFGSLQETAHAAAVRRRIRAHWRSASIAGRPGLDAALAEPPAVSVLDFRR